MCLTTAVYAHCHHIDRAGHISLTNYRAHGMTLIFPYPQKSSRLPRWYFPQKRLKRS
jgi:hypothetical protein